jgi:hypothetical protein
MPPVAPGMAPVLFGDLRQPGRLAKFVMFRINTERCKMSIKTLAQQIEDDLYAAFPAGGFKLTPCEPADTFPAVIFIEWRGKPSPAEVEAVAKRRDLDDVRVQLDHITLRKMQAEIMFYDDPSQVPPAIFALKARGFEVEVLDSVDAYEGELLTLTMWIRAGCMSGLDMDRFFDWMQALVAPLGGELLEASLCEVS